MNGRIVALPEVDDEGNPVYDPETLLPYEKEVAELLTELTAANDAEATAQAAATIAEEIAKSEAALAALDEYEVEEFDKLRYSRFCDEDEIYHDTYKTEAITDQKEAIEANIASLKEQLESKKDNVLGYVSSMNRTLDFINAAIGTLLENAKWSQTALDAQREAAKAAAQGAIDDLAELAQTIADAKAEVAAFENVDAANYENSFYRLEKSVADEQAAIDAKVKNGEFTLSADVYPSDENDVKNFINTATNLLNQVVGNAALAELQAERDALMDVWNNEITYPNSADYTIQDYAEVNTEYWKVRNAVYAARDKINDLNSSTAYDAYLGGTVTDPETGEEVATGVRVDIEAAYAAIEELKTLLAEKKLFPEEPVAETSADFDGDGVVDIADYGALLQQVIYGTNDETYDLNGDGEVDILDINRWVNIYRAQTDVAAARGNESNNDTAALATSAENGVTRLAIVLNNASAYRSMQLDVEGAQVLAINTTDRVQEGMGLYKGETFSGATRVVLSSFNGRTITAGEGAVLYIDVVGRANVANLKVVDAYGNLISFDLSSGQATAINGVSTNTSMKERIYNMGGRFVNGLKKGINIIRNADGTSKKVIKK